MAHAFVKDDPTVDKEGKRLMDKIAGVVVHPLVTHTDHRGSLTELFNFDWGVHPDELVFAYTVEPLPGSIRGWLLHKEQDDRIATLEGILHVVLYDAREDSPTYGTVNEFYFDKTNRSLFTIPAGVYHTVHCLGPEMARFINFPTKAYNHANPDKYRLPLTTPDIPFDWTPWLPNQK